MKTLAIFILTICVIGARSACPKWDSVDVTYHTHDANFYKIKGNYYAYAVIPRPDHDGKKCLYFSLFQLDRRNFRVIFRDTDRL